MPDRNNVVYGLVSLAGLDIALPVEVLREVVACPGELTGLPVAVDGLLGAMDLRSLILPVLDLRPLIGRPAETRPDQVVVVVAHEGRLLGLLADEVHAVVTVAATSLHEMAAAGDTLLFSHTFCDPASGRMVSVLDAATILTRRGVPTVVEPASETDGVDGPGGARVTGTLMRCGSYVLALDVTQVYTTLQSPAVRPSVLDSDLCRGVTSFAGREVAVIDPLALLGFGQLPVEEIHGGVVLGYGSGYLVLALSVMLDLIEVRMDDILPLPAYAVRRPDLLGGLAELDGHGRYLVLDGPALLSEPDLVALARVNTATDGSEELPLLAASAGGDTEAQDADDTRSAPTYLTYVADLEVATRLEQIAEILPAMPFTPTEGDRAVLGVVVHRHAALPVLSLHTLLGRSRAADAGPGCLLLVAVDGDTVAFEIDALRTIDQRSWSDPTWEEQPVELHRVLQSSPAIMVGGQSHLLPELDLIALARAVRGTSAPAVPAPREPELDVLPVA